MAHRVSLLTGAFVLFGSASLLVFAGDLNPPPGAVSPTMLTLDELNNSLLGQPSACGEALPGDEHAGGTASVTGLFTSPSVPTGPIPIYSYALDLETIPGAQGQLLPPDHNEGLTFTRHLDEHTTGFFRAIHTNTLLPQVDLVLLDPVGAPLMTIHLTNAKVIEHNSSMTQRCAGGFSTVERVRLSYVTIEFVHNPTGASSGYNLQTGTPF